MPRPYNFSAGPATMPEPVLQQAAAEMLDWHGCGMGVMEMSHRGVHFGEILAQAEADLRALLAIPAHFKVLFSQGGALAHNAMVPLNLAGRHPQRAIDVVVTGAWSQKSAQEARRYGDVHIAASGQADGFVRIPDPATWQLRSQPAYVHLCSNETIHGVEFHTLPDLAALGCDAPLVIDFSSHVLSRPIDWSRVGLAFGGAQKNIGPAGLTLVVVREDLLGHALPICPTVFDYKVQSEQQSMANTPPTYAIYMAGLVFRWLLAQQEDGLQGVAAMEARACKRAQQLYDCIDRSALYVNPVHPTCRSRMNVPFFLRGDDGQLLRDPTHPRNQAFLQGAQARGLLQLRGHKAVGGMRASLYNAMPLAGVEALVEYMQEFERRA
ncbi:3-phosphoserine/phosphohydroxythreonine transaminase [Tepidimonas sp.]|uniref:3-phosphoserine/phosphohydroxythreonine transaminase n=1 Tax=Tepidimonas sp. TaxID=2002775 RepID=UPI0028CBEAE2|nr:3-phosphoserine/phosphohydroxythreonine transaminase [Tepidimonas sp.]MDT7929414.1 3-phosphoserine/phosphohydroxythreonine transaminase [Tepidimonas sp.]